MVRSRRAKIALWVGGGTAVYLVLAVIAFVTDVDVRLRALFAPALFIIMAATPLLAVFGLVEQTWLFSAPSIVGCILLVIIYTFSAYFITQYILTRRHRRNRHR